MPAVKDFLIFRSKFSPYKRKERQLNRYLYTERSRPPPDRTAARSFESSHTASVARGLHIIAGPHQ